MEWEKAMEVVSGEEGLQQFERETSIYFNEGSDEKGAEIYSACPTLVRHILSHSDIDPEWVSVQTGDNAVEAMDFEEWSEDDGDIVAVRGRMPVGLLKVGKTPRNSETRTNVISRQRDVNL